MPQVAANAFSPLLAACLPSVSVMQYGLFSAIREVGSGGRACTERCMKAPAGVARVQAATDNQGGAQAVAWKGHAIEIEAQPQHGLAAPARDENWGLQLRLPERHVMPLHEGNQTPGGCAASPAAPRSSRPA